MPPRVLSAHPLRGDKVLNPAGEHLGTIEDLMIDLAAGRIAYAVLSFGGFWGIGDKLFAIPWSALTRAADDRTFVLHLDKEKLKTAPGFDKQHWPEAADPRWDTHAYYGVRPYWENT